MLKIVQARCLLLLAVCALIVSGCGKSAEEKEPATPLTDTSGLLRYVPEDTPYVFGTLAPLPDAFVDKIEPKLDRMLAAYSRLIGVAFAEAQAQEKVEDAEAKRLDALVAELQSLMSVEGLANAGMTRESTLVLYGHGLLPVMRVTLTDATLFDDAMTRIEASAGEQLPVAEVDGTPYRYVEDENVRVIIATVGDEFVLTVAPSGLDDAALASLLGLELPARNIAQTGKLLDIARKYGYMHEHIGLVDTVRVAETFIEEPKGVDAVLLAMAGYDVGSLSDDCKTEFRALAEIAPRIVTGYEEISAERLRTNAVIELREDIASEIGTFVSPVPGLGTIYEGLFSFGMSLDIEAIRSFFDKRVAALQKEPWKCEHLLDAQDHLFAAREQALAQPVPPILYDFHGFLAVVNELEGLDLAKKQPPDSIDASFLLAIDNAQGLLAMGQAMLPQLAEMNIEPDGKAHRFELPETGAEAETAWVALSESAIALSVSEDAETALPTLLKAEAGVPPPFMSVGIDGARYYSLVGEAMRASDDEEMSEEMREALSDVLAVAEEFYERLQIDVTFTARGIEIDSDANFAD